MSIHDVISNDLIQDKSSVWVLRQHSEFDYSDGVESERYLESVFRRADDLSSTSCELEKYIKDWPSEYHLSVKRAQLFSGFEFDSSLKVLEVGCGCGAITRYLGENFTDVVSVEGSIHRARLARLRTKELEGVSIVCAPFQEISFSGKFDIIFCIGVYEYSASFVVGDTPYDSVLSYFSDVLTPNGIVVIAIENQFGLKYFNSAREDHLGKRFVGLEGYHTHGNKVRTFGKYELEDNLRKYFSSVKFYYPYPDYKLPDCVISEEFISSSRSGELVSQIRSRDYYDYYGEMGSLWDEPVVSLELSKNRMLSFFSNSFLVFAGKTEIKGTSFDQLAVIASTQRTKAFRARTRVYYDENGKVVVSKKPLSGDNKVVVDKLALVASHSAWKDSYSLQTVLYARCMSKELMFSDIFMPCKAWVDYLEDMSEHIDGDRYLNGEYIDCIFSNAYLDSAGISIIDKEWIWGEKVKLNVLVIRSVYTFLCRIGNGRHVSGILRTRSLKKLITLVADSIGVRLNDRDFTEFVEVESELQALVNNSKRSRNAITLQWMLFDRSSFYFFRKLKKRGGRIALHIKKLFARLRAK